MIRECQDNPFIQEDIENLSSSFLWETAGGKLTGRNVFITGGTGLIGSQLIYTLGVMNRLYDAGIRIYALVRDEDRARSVLGSMADRGDLIFIQGCAEDLADEVFRSKLPRMDHVIYGASRTSSRDFVQKPVDVIRTTLKGTEGALILAKDSGAESVIFLSSLEVYGVPAAEKEWVTEQDFGSLDPMSVRSSYSESKRMAECLVTSYASQYGVHGRVVRLSQTFGPGVRYDDGRVFMEFTRCALEGRDIVLHTQGRTVRTYLYTADAVGAILTVLAEGKDGEAYNASNPDTGVSIRELAERIALITGEGKTKVRVEIPDDISGYGYNPEMVIKLDTKKLSALGWHARTNLDDMIRRLAGGVVRT